MRLPLLIEPPLLPIAELCAMRLDGDCFALGDGVVAVDAPVDAAVRARSVAAAARQHDLTAERWTAAWIHGAHHALPRPHQFCVDVRRTERTARPGGSLREVLLEPDEVVRLGGLAVTTPLRTATDLARLERDGPALAPVLMRLLAAARVAPHDAAAHLEAAVRSPYKRRGLARLRELEAAAQPALPRPRPPQPADTR